MPRHHSRSQSPLEERHGGQNQKPAQKCKNDCRICNKDHPLRRCITFKKMNVADKLEIVRRYRYCENCLAHSHAVKNCRNTDRCRQCKGKHHTLLHRHKRLSDGKGSSSNLVRSSIGTVTLLPTIIVKIELGKNWGNVRGLLNPCAESTSIAEFLTERYELPVVTSGDERWCKIKIRPRFDDGPVFIVNAKIDAGLPRKQPKNKIDERVASLYTNLRLADPSFYKNLDINIILGADIYPRLIKPTIQPEAVGSPMAQDTVLGWTIIGRFGV